MSTATARGLVAGCTLALVAGGAAAAEQGNVQRAADVHLKAGQCVACHGMSGISSNPLFPHLAGQQAGYLQRQLEAFRDGERYNPLMTPVARSLSDAEVRALAEHFSRLGPLAAAGNRTASSR